jgi:hypothetical protein
MQINLNDEVQFCITADGLEILTAHERTLGMEIGLMARCWRYKPDSGQCEAPLWDVMHHFGPCMTMGTSKHPIKNNELILKGVKP